MVRNVHLGRTCHTDDLRRLIVKAMSDQTQLMQMAHDDGT